LQPKLHLQWELRTLNPLDRREVVPEERGNMNWTDTSAARRMWRRGMAALGATAALTVGIAISSAGADGTAPQTPGVMPPSSTVQGKTYSQWSAAQWQWTIQQQDVTHHPDSPVVDPNPGTAAQPEPVNCALGQTGTVWFLAGTTSFQTYSTAYRSCSVPAGVFLFFPVLDVWNDNLSCPNTPPGTLTGQQLRQIVKQQTDTIIPNSMNVTVDGRSVKGLTDSTTAYRAAANGFTYTLPADNALSAFCPGDPFPAGTSPPSPPGAYADGVYIMLAPLAAGVHHISFAGAESGSPVFGPFSEDVTYTITVTG
jgi:hypothetical protein